MATINPAAAVRAVQRATVGKSLQAKQDRAANNARIDEVMQWRPRDMRPLTAADYIQAGKRHDIPPVKLAVLSAKESGSEGGFQRDGRVTIMAEPAKFSQFTAGVYDVPTRDPLTEEEVPALSYPKFVKRRENHKLPKAWKDAWLTHPYDFSFRERWQLWSLWATYNFDAAVKSISIGRFQVMGFHWEKMGFASPMEMLRFAYDSEQNHLELCLRWFKMNDMLRKLKDGNWYQIAIYNGNGDRDKYALECAAIEKKLAKQFQA